MNQTIYDNAGTETLSYLYAHPYVLTAIKASLLPLPNEFNRIKKSISYRFMVVAQGECTLFISGTSYHLEKNDLVFFQPGDIYQTVPNGEMIVINVYFTFNPTETEKFSTRAEPEANNESQRYIIQEYSFFQQAFVLKNFVTGSIALQKILQCVSYDLLLQRKRQNLLLAELIVDILEYQYAWRCSNDATIAHLESVMTYIKENMNKKITCTSVAQHCGYHPNSLNRLFRKAMGKSLHTIILETKIKKSTELLMYSNQSISSIAQELGFSDSSHFSRCYYQVTGLLPSEIRRSVTDETIGTHP